MFRDFLRREPPQAGPETAEPAWWRALSDDAIDHLLTTSHARLLEDLSLDGQQERKVSLFITWVVALISVSGLFGDLRLGGDPTGIASWTALALTLIVFIVGLGFLWPRTWDGGVDVDWLSRYAGASARALRGETLAANVRAVRWNRRVRERRVWFLWGIVLLLPFQGFAVVAVQVLAALQAP